MWSYFVIIFTASSIQNLKSLETLALEINQGKPGKSENLLVGTESSQVVPTTELCLITK